jgi:hypothetical protein
MKFKNSSKLVKLIFPVLLILLSACDLDINVDPNTPPTSDNKLLLPSAQASIALALGQSGDGLGSATSIWVHQVMQRSNADGYASTGDDANINNPWLWFYRNALPDLNTIIEQGTNQGQFQYVGIAKLLKAYMYHMMVDVWGDIPYSEAGNGTETAFPKFDKGADIYADLFKVIDDALVDLTKPAPAGIIPPGADDLIYGGNVTHWTRFAKVLKLKMYNTIRKTGDYTTQIQALVADTDVINFGNPTIAGFTPDFEFRYFNRNAPENRNPAFITVNNGRATYFSIYFYEILNNKSQLNRILEGITDPRFVHYCYNSLGSTNATAQNPTEYLDGRFLSINFSSQHPNQGFAQGRSLSAPGLYYCGGNFDDQGRGGQMTLASASGAAPQRLLCRYQVSYIRAELALAGVTSEDAGILFAQAINDSFAKVNSVALAANPTATQISTTARDTYRTAVVALYDAAAPDRKLEHIITQKWIANFGNSVESYTDYRRTGFPIMFDVTTDGNSNTNGARPYPFSMPYRQSDILLNPNAPPQKLIGTNDARVFWDVD